MTQLLVEIHGPLIAHKMKRGDILLRTIKKRTNLSPSFIRLQYLPQKLFRIFDADLARNEFGKEGVAD